MTNIPETEANKGAYPPIDETVHREGVLNYIGEMAVELSVLADQIGAPALSDSLRRIYRKTRGV
ncbi:hypothetical protein PQU92_02255 [Asticcacaulis sp. BYS171W]|uniref:Uncharacterized protein n=1 Tax=Asticcacaulis aquaticus TaxID=2984212 RepID=A0ABT5HPS7_9CAUL|nr:hypothetical protein [Asticcacaulis aquaticus]MDC7682078.1 hypothetical protein [Asticcacaulis aquaticus]